MAISNEDAKAEVNRSNDPVVWGCSAQRSGSDSASRVSDWGPKLTQAIQFLLESKGRVIFTGLGKTGYVARKAAATFCSTGTPAIFLHPSEALHGDLGVVSAGDVLIAVSNSGETAEVINLLPHMARLGIPVIALTGDPQ